VKKYWIILFTTIFISLSLVGQDTLTKREIKKQKKNFLLPGKPWVVEIPLWLPGFTGSFGYGEVSIEGEDGQEIENPIEPPPPPNWGDIFNRIFSTKWYLKFFLLNRVAYEKNRFLAQFDAIAGAVGESTEFNYNSKQIVQANFRTINMRLFAGYKLVNATGRQQKFRYELFAYLGVRAHFHKIYSDLDGLINRLDINPVWYEPVIGLQNQFTWKRWFIAVQGDYGGFFVPQKYSVQISGYVYYRSGRVVSLKAGWSQLILNHTGTFLGEDFRIQSKLSGPGLGIAFHF
jgi:hypothetical protein